MELLQRQGDKLEENKEHACKLIIAVTWQKEDLPVINNNHQFIIACRSAEACLHNSACQCVFKFHYTIYMVTKFFYNKRNTKQYQIVSIM